MGLRFLMEELQNNTLKEHGTKIKDMRVQETSLIHKVWGGYLRSQIKCCKCGNESNTYDSILDLSLEIKGPSVRTAFKHFTDPEVLDGDNKYQCDNCSKKRRAIKQLTVFEAPNILSLHLKRFESNGSGMFSGGKINKHVKFGQTLDLSEFMSYDTAPKVTYSLFSVLVHYGYSSHGGHYVSFCKAPNNEWYLMDDSRVQSVASLNSVLREKAYLLFYKRNENKILYKSPNQTPKLTKMKNMQSNHSSFDSLQKLADTLPSISPIRDAKKRKIKSKEVNDAYTEWKQNEKKRKLDNEVVAGEACLNKSPTKKRKIECGESMPIKLDKASQNKQLRLLKQRISKRKKSLTASSSPSYSSSRSTLRHRNRTLIGRRSNSLKLAAKSSLNTNARWNQKRVRRCTQMPIHSFQKMKQSSILSDSSSESVLSENNQSQSSNDQSSISCRSVLLRHHTLLKKVKLFLIQLRLANILRMRVVNRVQLELQMLRHGQVRNQNMQRM